MSQFDQILSIAYAPPISYFSQLAKSNLTRIEAHENYQKQSFRNRCNILSSAGIQTLIIPIKHGHSLKIKEIEIDYKEDWQKKHWRSLITCYNSSPYFVFYRDDFESAYQLNYRFLFDWNLAILEIFCNHFKMTITGLTVQWKNDYLESTDFRDKIHPKKVIQSSLPFHDTTFQVNNTDRMYLSAFDLLFNAGPDFREYI
jgi:hypothetical protein